MFNGINRNIFKMHILPFTKNRDFCMYLDIYFKFVCMCLCEYICIICAHVLEEDQKGF